MNPIKMLCLAALAISLAMAFASASSAKAELTALCSNDVKEKQCTEVTHVHETSIGKAVLKSSLITIECTALFLGDTVESTAAPVVIKGAYTYSGCSNSCTVKEGEKPAEITILRTATELGTVTGKGLLHLTCPFGECNYVGESLKGHALGALSAANKKGEVSFVEQKAIRESGGGLCPAEAVLTIKTEPLSEFFISGWSMVCIFVGANQGHYLSFNAANSRECTNFDTGRTGSYELAFATTDTPNQMVCAWVGANNGLWLARRWWPNSSECKDLDKNILNEILRVGEYELGTTS